MNSGVVEAFEHLSLVGAGAAHSRFDQSGDSDAALHDGVMHLSRDARPLRQPQVITVAGLSLVEKKHPAHACAGGGEREAVKPAGLVKVRLHDKKDAGLGGTAVERSVISDHAKAISARRKIVIICGSAPGGGDPFPIEPIQPVSKSDTLRSAQTARRKLDLHAPPARADHHLTRRGNNAVINQYGLHANRRVALAQITIGLEMDSSLDARKPYFTSRSNAAGGLDASVNLRG